MATWAKSSQYRGMPHQQYMQTEEGQKAGQFFREDAQRMREGRNTPQRTGFATGQAQSQQSPYTSSTPYQKNPAGDFAAYSPQQNTQQFGNTTLNQSYSPGTSPYGQAPQMPTSPTDGNLANYATPERPTFQARYGQPDGSFSDSPNYNQRDAFIQALNNQQTPYMTGQARGMPQYDIGSAFNQASQMVQQGFQNPFAPNLAAQPQQPPLQNLAAQAFPSQYQGLTMAPQPRQAPQQGGLADIQRRLSNATTQEQLLEINRDGRAMMQQQADPRQSPSPTTSTGVRVAPGGGPSWTPVPGYGFDRQGNQAPVGKGGTFNEPPPQRQQAESPYSGGLIKNAGSDRLGSWMSSRRAENKRLAADAFQRAKTPEEKMQAFRFPQNYGIYT